MRMGKTSYEECRQRRLEENKKRMEDLNLLRLSNTLHSLSPKPSPMKKVSVKPRITEKELVAVRRSARVANNPAPVYVEVRFRESDIWEVRCTVTYGVSKKRDLSNRLYASEEVRACALEKAEQLVSEKLDSSHPTLVRSMLPSHVTGGFWLVIWRLEVEDITQYGPIRLAKGLPRHFCRKNLPRCDELITLVDEEGDEYLTVWLERKMGLSGGWKGFSVAHDLVDGDAVVFQVIKHGVLKVYIIRANDMEEEEEES